MRWNGGVFLKRVAMMTLPVLLALAPLFAEAEPWIGHLEIKDSTVWPGGHAGNYGTVHYFVDEAKGEKVPFDVLVQIYSDGRPPSDVKVELFTNLNRRDHAKVWENPADVNHADSYYKAIPMTHAGRVGNNELYKATLRAERTGAYRLTARFRIGNGPWQWHNAFKDGDVLQRDCAIVISPRKVLSLTMYEANPFVVEATTGGHAQERSTFEDFTNHDHDGFNPFSLDYVRKGIGFNTLWLMPIFPKTNIRWDERVKNGSTTNPQAAPMRSETIGR